MIWEYGSHRHPNAEVEIKSTGKRAMISPRGDVYAYELFANLAMTLRNSSGADSLVTQATELERVYSVQNQRATLYTNSGKVAFRLDPTRSLNGLQIRSLVYPDVSGAAMVTTLKAEITLSMQEEVAGGPDLLDFEETVEFSGGLPKVVYLPTSQGPSVRQTTRKRTPYVAVQRGMAVGKRARPTPPRLLFPGADILDYRIGKASPSRLRQGVYREFSVQWSVTYMSNDVLNAEPTIM